MTTYPPMPKLNYHDAAIRLLSEGYSEEFAEFCAGDDRVHELIQDLATEFVSKNIPIVKEDDAHDVAFELLMGVTIRKV